MNIQSKMDGWEQYYSITITRSSGLSESFEGIEGHKVVELVNLCLTIDDPYSEIVIKPIKPSVIH